MRSALRTAISDPQLDEFMQFVMRRYNQIKGDMEASSYWKERERVVREAASDFCDRLSGENTPLAEQRIFDLSNLSSQMIRSIVRFLVARICKDMFGSKPWLAVKPRGRLDEKLVDQLEPHARFKLEEADFEDKIKAAIRRILELGECPVKITHYTTEDSSEAFEMVLVDKTTGKPIVTPDGDYIYPTDETEAVAQEPSAPALNPANEPSYSSSSSSSTELNSAPPEGDPSVQPPTSTAATRFSKAPEIVLDRETMDWAEIVIPKTERLFHGLCIDPCDWKDVGWPLNHPDIQTADFVFHRYDMRLSQLRARFDPQRQSTEIQELLESFSNGDTSPQAEGAQAKPEHGETDISGDMNDPIVHVVEAWGEYTFQQPVVAPSSSSSSYSSSAPSESQPVDGALPSEQPSIENSPPIAPPSPIAAGRPVRFSVVFSPDKMKAFYLEYRAAVSPRAAIPLFLPAINRPLNRAYGIGQYRLFRMMQEMSDALLNQVLVHNERACEPVEISNLSLTLEGKASPNRRLKRGDKLTPANAQTDLDKVAKFLAWPDLDDRTWEMMQYFLQIMQAESGVTNAAQAAVSELPGNDLATGINALAEVASVLHLYILEEVRDGIEPIVGYAMSLVYARMDENEVYEFLEGDADAVLALKDARTLAKLPINVQILLTRSRKEEQRTAAMAALPLLYEFFAQPPTTQMRVRKALEQGLAGLGYDHPGDMLPTAEELAQMAVESVDPVLVEGLLANLQAAGYVIQPPSPTPGAPGDPNAPAPTSAQPPQQVAPPPAP